MVEQTVMTGTRREFSHTRGPGSTGSPKKTRGWHRVRWEWNDLNYRSDGPGTLRNSLSETSRDGQSRSPLVVRCYPCLGHSPSVADPEVESTRCQRSVGLDSPEEHHWCSVVVPGHSPIRSSIEVQGEVLLFPDSKEQGRLGDWTGLVFQGRRQGAGSYL